MHGDAGGTSAITRASYRALARYDRPDPGRPLTPDDPLLALLDAGRIREAIALAQGVAESPTREIVLAWADIGPGRLEEARARVRPVVARLDAREEERPRLAHALLCLGVATVSGGGDDRGIVQLERAIALHDGIWLRAQALRYVAWALESRGAWAAAAERYDAAAALYARLGNAFGAGSAGYGAATALDRLGRHEEAERRLRDAVALLRTAPGPALASALGLLAVVVAPRDPEGARALLAEAEAQETTQPLLHADLLMQGAHVERIFGAPAAALARARQAAELMGPATVPGAGVRAVAGWASLALGRVADARASFAEIDGVALAGMDPHAGLAAVAALAGQLEEHDARMSAFARGVAATRSSPVALACLAMAADALEPADPERAARVLRVSLRAGAAPGAVLPRLAALAGRGARPAVGPVRLTRLLGEGGMGRVWAGEHRDTGDPVAVKVLHAALLSPETRALFEAEARAVARLDHPGVVRVLAASRLDAGEAAMLALEAGTPAIVMERVDAGALDPYGPAWRWEGARDLLLALLDALAHAHARGVLHLDVKPSNVLVARDGAARLVDFGLAGMVGVLEGHVLGTPAYMAPEQTLGRDLGPWTDLYAVGVTAWELVTGARPFADPDVGTLLALQRHAPLPAFRPRFAVPAGLEAWLRVLLDKEPGARFSRAADAAHALRCLGEPVGIGRAVVPPRDHPATFHVSGPAATTRVLVHAGEPRPATFTRATPPPAPFPAARSEPRPTPRPFLPESGEGLLGWRVPRLRGRDAERERLWACLAEVHATRVGRAVAIVGPPGSGRSRLAQWLAEEAHATGAAHVVHVRAADGDAAAEEVMARKADRPVVALLEDADGVAGLLGLVRALADAGVLVVLTATRPPPLDAETIPLGPLSPADLMGLLDELLPIDRALAIALVERAAGSPAAGVAMLADLVARDALAPGAEGFGLRPGEAIAFARRALSAWTRRADAVAPPGSPARAALEIAAVAGTKVAREEWAAACSDAGVFELDAAVAPLREAGLLVVGEDVDLADQALREAIVEAATASGRAPVWHGVWAARARDPGRLGRHLLFAGRPLEALGPLRAGAADAVNAVRLVACRELLELWDRAADAAGLAEDDPRRASPLVVRSFLAYHLGEDELAPLARALPLVAGRDAHEEARIRYSTGMALRHADRPAEAEVAFRDALALVDDPGSMMPGLCLAGLAAARFEQGADGSAEIERARARLAERWPALADRCDVVLGQGLQRVGRRAEARAALLRGEAVTRAQGWRLDEAEVLRDLARIAVAEGDVADAEARLTRACAILRAAGSDRQFEAEAELAELLLGAGRGEEARALAAAALARFGWRMEAGLRARLELAGAAGG